MDINDLKKTANKQQVSIKDATGTTYKFETNLEFIDFLREEASYWHNLCSSTATNELITTQYEIDPNNDSTYIELEPFDKTILSGLYFKGLVNTLNRHTLEKSNYGSDKKSFDIIKKELISGVEELINSIRFENWIYSKNPIWLRALEISQSLDTKVADSFLQAFIGNPESLEINNFNALKGYLLASEFEIQDNNLLKNRVEFEEESIINLKNSILNTRSELYKDSEEHNSKIESYYEKWIEKISTLESTYEEKLRLSKPAEYWKNKALTLKKSGDSWRCGLIILITIGLIGFGSLLFVWISHQSELDKVGIESIQGLAFFITILSIYAFALKSVSKIVFSTYHLQRDAEEREQLTYLYLSLINEGAEFDAESRNIVLQSLFSRVDSGLISGDSSPTMPGLHEIIKISSSKS